MTLTFRYKEVSRLNKTRARSPSIPMTLSGGGTKYDFTVLLDSGADISAISKQVAELLGLNLKGPTEDAFGIGGHVQSIKSHMHIEFGKPHERYSFEVPVRVILSDDSFPPLIGRAVFFDKFVISFKQSQDKVELKAIPERNRV